ncbi:MAG: MFS transporter, partial [Gammaproteobacteria bacterium]|nr:MFS transporter [Gammaproteobacteria bacterium]
MSKPYSLAKPAAPLGAAAAVAEDSFWKSGHLPTLITAFLYFDLSFMVWYLLGPLSVQIAESLALTPQQRGLLVATPILAGALLRLVWGLLVDHLRPKRAGTLAQIIVIVALSVAWLHGIHSFAQALLLGLALGVAGAAFAVALPLASRWYPPQHQGKALGIAGAGNSGTVFAALLAPGLAALFGWEHVFGLAVLPLLLVLVLYIVYAKDSPECPPPKRLSEYLGVLKDRDPWWFMFF